MGLFDPRRSTLLTWRVFRAHDSACVLPVVFT